jgi:hypothetical protein
MKLNILLEPFPHFIVNDLFDEVEQKFIWDELMFLSNRMNPPEMTYTSMDSMRRLRKRGSGVFLNEFYTKPENSTIALCAGRAFSTPILNSVVDTDNLVLKWFKNITSKNSLYVQMYKNGDYYDSHDDACFFTSVTLFHKTPKQYSGGDLGFSDYDYVPELNHNSMICFPSCVYHSVSEVKLKNNENENARFTLTQFLYLG